MGPTAKVVIGVAIFHAAKVVRVPIYQGDTEGEVRRRAVLRARKKFGVHLPLSVSVVYRYSQ